MTEKINVPVWSNIESVRYEISASGDTGVLIDCGGSCVSFENLDAFRQFIELCETFLKVNGVDHE